MLKLPVCPHCKAVYSFSEVKKMKQGVAFCYHCKKKFRVNKTKGAALFILIVCILLITANTAIMVSSENFVSVIIILADAAVITAVLMLLPFTVRFRAEKLTKAEKREKKNRQQ